MEVVDVANLIRVFLADLVHMQSRLSTLIKVTTHQVHHHILFVLVVVIDVVVVDAVTVGQVVDSVGV